MNLIEQRRRAAHVHCAAVQDRTAEFHSAVADFFESLGDALLAQCAQRLAEGHRQRASQERAYADAAGSATGIAA